MSEQDYKELNDYMNEIFKRLEVNDSFLLRNLLPITNINGSFINFMKNYHLEINKKENNLTFEDVYLLAREIIESINPNYLKDYDNLIKSGELDFDYENNLYCSLFTYFDNDFNYLIDIKRNFNYDDVLFMVHEFMHYTNGKHKKSNNRYLLTEFLSIYFENYALDYLLKKGINKKEINYNDRFISTLRSAKAFNIYVTSLLSYKNFGSIDLNNLPFINQYFFEITKEQFENECSKILNKIRNIKKEYESEIMTEDFDEDELNDRLLKLFNNNYRYVFGTLLAIYADKYCDMKDIVNLNDHINDEKYGNMDLIELLNLFNIPNIDSKDFLLKLSSALKEYTQKYNKEKSR